MKDIKIKVLDKDHPYLKDCLVCGVYVAKFCTESGCHVFTDEVGDVVYLDKWDIDKLQDCDFVEIIKEEPEINPNRHKHYDLIMAWANGSKVQYRSSPDSDWADAPNPNWHEKIEYRIKPVETDAEVYGIEIGDIWEVRDKLLFVHSIDKDSSGFKGTAYVMWAGDRWESITTVGGLIHSESKLMFRRGVVNKLP